MNKLIFGLSFLLTACALHSTPESSGKETLLFNPVISTTSLNVSVMSNGCTKPAHFYLLVEGQNVELRRTEADLCRAAPHLVRLAFDYPFGQSVYKLKNNIRFHNRIKR